MSQPPAEVTAHPPLPCPRCGAETGQCLYGPCPTCRADLVAKFAGRATAGDAPVEAAERIHRTPNFVATKD